MSFRKFIQKDKAILNKTLGELKEKSRSLQAQEENVRKLRQQLEAAQKIALANRVLINRLRNQAKAVKEKVGKKQLAASNFEEDLLRAKSILSAVRRKMPDVGDTGSGRNSPQMDSLRGVCNENQKFMITSATAQEIQSSLAAKLDKLSALSKLENREKRKLEGNSDSSEETVSCLRTYCLRISIGFLILLFCFVRFPRKQSQLPVYQERRVLLLQDLAHQESLQWLSVLHKKKHGSKNLNMNYY